ncbi:MAG: hypothetical protein KAT27_10055, partial [Desulfobacterales bacterium]|nr:hypothetical protein [Desulfobacterales bacterium]
IDKEYLELIRKAFRMGFKVHRSRFRVIETKLFLNVLNREPGTVNPEPIMVNREPWNFEPE